MRAEPAASNKRFQPGDARPGRRSRGFTLVELMIAVVIVGVIAAVAFPSFMDSIRKGRRSEAFAALNAVQLAQERWRANNPTYANQLTNGPAASPPGLGLSATTPSGYYAISVSNTSASGYTALATAQTGTSQANDGDCAKLSVRMNGGTLLYGSSTLAGTPTESAAGNRCWSR